MLSAEELAIWYRKLQISEQTRNVIDQIRASEPSRNVGGGPNNVWGRYPSRKMGRAIQFESHTLELAGILEYENDDEVLEYYDQPPKIKLTYESASGRNVRVGHTADFFVIRQSSAAWEEWKTEEALEHLKEAMPHRYVQGESGVWICPPGEKYGAEFGFSYALRSSNQIDTLYQRNLRFMEDFLLRGRLPEVDPDQQQLIKRIAKEIPGLSLTQLKVSVQEQFRDVAEGSIADIIFACIAHRIVYVDLRRAALAEPDRARIYLDKSSAPVLKTPDPGGLRVTSLRCNSKVVWDDQAWTVINVGTQTVSLISSTQTISEIPIAAFEELLRTGSICIVAPEKEASESADLLSKASLTDLKIALERHRLINDYQESEQGRSQSSERSKYRYKAAYRGAEEEHGNGLVGLLPRVSDRGNRTTRLGAAAEIMEKHIKSDFETLKAKGMHASWLLLDQECATAGISTPTYKTYRKACKRRPKAEQLRKRKGRRAAYPLEEMIWLLDLNTPRHGDRPFEIGHIDHTELDVELVGADGKRLGRPWLTLFIDAYSREVLAFWVWFEKPSYRSCMMVIRECVRKHGRLPQTIVVDGGPEFRSTYFEVLLARCESTKKTRPKAKSRFGSVIERMFGTSNTQFIHNLRGQTKITRNVRIVTKSVNPKTLATWTLPELHSRMREYFFEVYASLRHPALSDTPRNTFVRGLNMHGLRFHRMIPYDRAFMILTLPSTAKGTVKLNPGRGVTVNYIQYWCEAFRDPDLDGHDLPVRYDPFDADVAFVYCRNQWVECHSSEPSLKGRTEQEIRFASQELRKNKQLTSVARFSTNARIIGRFLASTEADEALQIHRAQSREVAGIMAESSDQNVSENPPRPAIANSDSLPQNETVESSELPDELYGDLL